MKLRSLLLPLLLAAGLQGHGQKSLSAAEWQSDLRWLQQTVHDRYAMLFTEWPAHSFDSSADALYRAIPQLSPNEIRAGFLSLVAGFRIGHTGIRFSYADSGTRRPLFHQYPYSIDLFEEGVFIRNIDRRYASAAGARVLGLGGLPIDTVLRRIYSVVPAENEQFFAANLHYYLRLPEVLQGLHLASSADSIALEIEKDGKRSTLWVRAEEGRDLFPGTILTIPDNWVDAGPLRSAAAPLWMQQAARLRAFQYDPKTATLYVRHSGVWEPGGETIAAFFRRVFRFADSVKADRFILDLRLNGGGDNYLNKPVVTGIIRNTRINRYGHLFVLLGRHTFSAAQNLTNALEKYTEAVFIGEPTSEHVNFWGDNRTEVLPASRMEVCLSYLWWQDSDPRDTRRATAPLLAAPITFADYRAGTDPALAAVRSFHEQGPVVDRFNALWDAGKRDAAEAVLHAFVQDPVHRYVLDDVAGDLNSTGEYLLYQGKGEEAARWYTVLQRQFPRNAAIAKHSAAFPTTIPAAAR